MEAALLAIGDGAHQQREVARYWVIQACESMTTMELGCLLCRHRPRTPGAGHASPHSTGYRSLLPASSVPAIGRIRYSYGIVGRPAES
jgi:hypothetical protein